MKDTFQGKLGHYKVSFRMLPKDNQFEVLVENIQTFERYRTIIDQRFIQNSGRLFEETFSSLQDLFNFLTQNLQEIEVGDGAMTFVYGVINKIPKKVSFQLNKEEVDKDEQVNLKIDKIQQEISAKINERYSNWKLFILLIFITVLALYYHQNRIHQLEQRIQSLTGNLREQYQQNYTQFIDWQTVRQSTFRRTLQEIFQNERKLREKLGKNIRRCNKRIYQLFNKTQQIQNSLGSRLKKLQGNLTKIDHFGHHPNNSHKDHFIITPVSATSIKLSKIKSGFYNFVNKYELTSERQTKYTVKMTKKVSNSVTIGFTSRKGFGVIDNYGSSQSRWIHVDIRTSKELSSAGAVQGDTVECIADLAAGKFSWWKAGTKFYECDIPTSMKGNPIFFSVQFPNIEDQLEISV